MAQTQTNKEALFNEVKGSLFEYLVARELSLEGTGELEFQRSLDRNYLSILSQQDRMVRQFYPEMLPFLCAASREAAVRIITHIGEVPKTAKVVGKFSDSHATGADFHEADLILSLVSTSLPVSLKLNKKNAFVNTKSGGVKSFFTQYFPFLEASVQERFNQFIGREFDRMAYELHAHNELDYPGHFELWVSRGLSELPGELDNSSRLILKAYYARIAQEMHSILKEAFAASPDQFRHALPALMGFSSRSILQVIFFHDFPKEQSYAFHLNSYHDVFQALQSCLISSFADISSVEISLDKWILQLRVKPMNKFTTTALKINCSIKRI
jgi:hypothetical protein